MKIFLIGMPGSGKSTLGKQLAAELSLLFIDLDTEIEKEEGQIVKDIFSSKGEDYFRLAESKALKKIIASYKSFVLATGGGAPCFHNGIDIINNAGISIFLDVSVKELVSRVQNNTDRPLLNNESKVELEEKLKHLLEKRLKIYKQA